MGRVASHSRLDLHVRSVLFLSHSHEHSFPDFDRPSILSYVDLGECFLLVFLTEGGRVHHILSIPTLHLFRRCFLSDWTFLV